MYVPVDCVKNFNEHRVVILFMGVFNLLFGLLEIRSYYFHLLFMFLLYSRLKKFIVDVTMCLPTLKKE